MNIEIQGTKVIITGDRVIGFQLNNLVNRFEATTDKSEEWEYTLYVYMIKPEKYNTINLNRIENQIYVDLTCDMMPFDGRYEMQFVANKPDTGEIFRTEKFQVWVENSINPSSQWEPVPSEFYQIEENIQKIYLETKKIYEDIQDGNVFGDIQSINGGNAFGTK